MLRALFGLVACWSLTGVWAHCPNFCSGNGRCVAVSKCECFGGWAGGDCSLRSCPSGPAWADMAIAIDVAHQPAECSARGHCDVGTGRCECDIGFTGEACERMLCPVSGGSECNGNGRCVLPLVALRYGHSGLAITTCQCDRGWGGYSCAEPLCAFGDDPMTVGQVDEVQLMRCDLDAGAADRLTLGFRGFTTRPFSPGASAWELRQRLEALPIVGKVSVSYSSGVTFCAGGGSMSNNLVAVTFITEFGPQPVLLPNSPKVSVVRGGNDLTYATPYGSALAYSVAGTKEWLPCSGRGQCNVGGICKCFAGFVSSSYLKNHVVLPGDCGYPMLPVTSCPGFPLECGGNGLCSGAPEYKCTCYEGWSGGDCSQRTCPTGPSWVTRGESIAECSDRGSCDRRTGSAEAGPLREATHRSGRCMCQHGVTGAACERMVCPGAEGPEVCSGHGRCLTMSDLALEARRPDGDPLAVSYGEDPNDMDTWDGWRIYGCACDEGWTGHDCSLRSCLVGMDETDLEAEPFLRDEIQELRCEWLGSMGGLEPTFVLTFRGAQTQPLSARASAEDVRTALENLETIREIGVEFVSSEFACAPVPGNIIRLKFQTEHGDVPPIRVLAEEGWIDVELRFSAGSHTYLKKAPLGFSEPIETAEVVKGTTREAECSGRGLCDRETGRCECFEGFGASNGRLLPKANPLSGGSEGFGADKWGRESCGGRVAWLGGRGSKSLRHEPKKLKTKAHYL